MHQHNIDRRAALSLFGMGAAASALPAALAEFYIPGRFAEELTTTPWQTEGPFYPKPLPLDTDNDLLLINDKITPAVGKVTHLTGKVMDIKGNPMRGVLVEIWQVDGQGVYLHQGSAGKDKRDKNFQGFGRFLTDRKGQYYFRTVQPVPYPGRTPHIHVKVKRGEQVLLTTQCYISGHAQNRRDGVLRGIKDKKELAAIMVDFKPIKGSKIGALEANFDIVLGMTPR